MKTGARDELATVRTAFEHARRILGRRAEMELPDATAALEALADASQNLLTRTELMEEVRSPTWRLLYPERDSLLFTNDWGETARLLTAVAVAIARGEHIAWTTNVVNGIVEYALADGTKGTAPLTLMKALAPRRWPARIANEEAGA